MVVIPCGVKEVVISCGVKDRQDFNEVVEDTMDNNVWQRRYGQDANS